ncbi:hypothetical protein HHI36_022955 [Cryptolaemus montrouzieri]|uniref:Uncharacterized protein n=1 Tax=Cryptolaemus montrouzieri TaxID=559131 RepID=A0ABD2PFC5_9CUCU
MLQEVYKDVNVLFGKPLLSILSKRVYLKELIEYKKPEGNLSKDKADLRMTNQNQSKHPFKRRNALKRLKANKASGMVELLTEVLKIFDGPETAEYHEE